MLLVIPGLLLLMLSACSPAKQQSKTTSAAAAIPVTTAAAQKKDVPTQLRAIGTVRPFSTVSVKSQVDGQLVKIGVKEGYETKKDELIFTIEPMPFKVGLDQAQAVLARDVASLQNAESDMRRTDELANTKAVATTLVEENRAKVASLKGTVGADEAAVEIAKVQLSHCYIRSPIDGRVGLLIVNEGNVIKNNDTVLAIINQFRPIYVDFAVPEQHLAGIRERMAQGSLKVEALARGQTSRNAEGQLRLINNQVDPTTGTILLRGEFPNQDELLWPGQFVDVALTLSVEKNATIVPADAIQFSQQGRYVIIVKPDQTVEFRPVEIGDSLAQEMVIKKGVQPGEQIVTSGQLRLQPGAKVDVRNAEPVTKAGG
jgi:multidrug efflux system membrane fusion protein